MSNRVRHNFDGSVAECMNIRESKELRYWGGLSGKNSNLEGFSNAEDCIQRKRRERATESILNLSRKVVSNRFPEKPEKTCNHS